MMNPRIFWVAALLFVLAACQTTSPMEQAFMDMNREDVFHQIQSSPDPQSARDQALVRSVYWTRVREPHRSFHTALSKELVRSGANVHADPHGMALSACGSPYAIDLLHELGFNLSTQDPATAARCWAAPRSLHKSSPFKSSSLTRSTWIQWTKGLDVRRCLLR